MIQDVRSDNRLGNQRGVIGIRKIVGVDTNPHIQKIIDFVLPEIASRYSLTFEFLNLFTHPNLNLHQLEKLLYLDKYGNRNQLVPVFSQLNIHKIEIIIDFAISHHFTSYSLLCEMANYSGLTYSQFQKLVNYANLHSHREILESLSKHQYVKTE